MIRGIKNYSYLSEVYKSLRLNSTQSASFQDKWKSAKSYAEVPKLTTFKMIRNFLPGGTDQK